MNSRERVLTTLRHEEPDRVPIDFGGTRTTGITAKAYASLLRYLSLDETPYIFDVKMQLAEVSREVSAFFRSDTVALHRSIVSLGLSNEYYKDACLQDGTHVRVPSDYNPVKEIDGSLVLKDVNGIIFAKLPAEGDYYDITNFPPLRAAESVKDLDNFNWDSFAMDSHEIDVIRKRAKYLYYTTDKAVIGNFWANVLERACALRGYAEFMMDLGCDVEFASELLDRIMNVYLNNLKSYIEAVKDYVQVICFSDDLGIQTGPMISMNMYKNFLKPRHKQLFEYVKDNSSMYVFLHTCGAIKSFIPELIEAGVDILNPIQITADGMDVKELKSRYGKSLTFWGGTCDTQHILPFSSPEEIKHVTKQNRDILSPGGGFVFAPIHNIQPGVPPENISAFFESAR